MSYQKHCPGCFRRKDGNPVCALCGYDEAAPRSPLFLPHGSVLAGQYRVGKVLGRPGGFGITYLGWDIYLQQRIAIKEFLPPEMAARVPDALHITVHTAEDRRSFDAGKDQFLREARIVARLDHPNVVRVRAFFNANDTAYMVMDYYEGMSLDAYFSQVKPTLEMGVVGSLAQMILDGLSYVHERGVVHRDVKPHNIYLAAVGKPILLDFGAARKNAPNHHRSISVVLTEGYAPLEQYQRHGEQGPWTDVYGTAATMHRMLTGRAPPVAIDRLHRDTLEAEDFPGIPEPLKPILRKALALQVGERYQSAAEFREAIASVLGSAPPLAGAVPTPSIAPPPASSGIGTVSVSAGQLLPEDTKRIAPRVRIVTPASPKAPDAPVRTAPPAAVVAPLTLPSIVKPTLERARSGASAVPRNPLLRWGVPLGLAALATLGLMRYWNSAPDTSTASAMVEPPTTMAAVESVSSTTEPSGPRRFRLNGLPTLSPESIPRLRATPAGAYARPGSAAVPIPSFRVTQTEITVADFALFIERSGYSNPDWQTKPCDGALVPNALWSNPGYDQTNSHPVVCIDQLDARNYAAWLAQETNRNFRLPTEAEWEYAAAAGSASNFWWGNQVDSEHASCADCGRPGERPDKPFLVNSMGQNAFGLFGTAGNVREWTCSDAGPPLVQACGAEDSTAARLVRGGSWHDPSIALTTTYRTEEARDTRNTWTGFRVVEALSP